MPAAAEAIVPAYKKIREMLRERIASGTYKLGDRLPSESELTREFGVARMTVRQALAQLVFENLIVSQSGRGSYVAARQNIEAVSDSASQPSFEEQIVAQGRTPSFKLLKFDKVEASAETADRLKIPPSSDVYRLERLRYVDDQLAGLEIRYLREDVGKRIPAAGLNSMSTFALVEAALNEPLGSVDVSIFAAKASKDTAAKLGIRAGAPVLVRDHVALDSAGVAVLYGNSIYRDHLRFRYVYPRQRAAT